MSYIAPITRVNPTSFLFVIDQSTSMRDALESGSTKAHFLADVVNKTLYTMAVHCTKADGVRDYFSVGVIGYRGDYAFNCLTGGLANQILNPISAVAAEPLRVEDRVKRTLRGGDVVDQRVKFPVWLDAMARGKTAMCAGLGLCRDVLGEWSRSHPQSYPATVLHITDGHPTDGDPEGIVRELMDYGTEDGGTLVFNLHLDIGREAPFLFPNCESVLKDKYAKKLFRMSSLLPDRLRVRAEELGYQTQTGARGFVFNADATEIVHFFELGTRVGYLQDR